MGKQNLVYTHNILNKLKFLMYLDGIYLGCIQKRCGCLGVQICEAPEMPNASLEKHHDNILPTGITLNMNNQREKNNEKCNTLYHDINSSRVLSD